MDFSPSIIAITGSTGFIGRHIVEALFSRGAYLRLLVRDLSRCPFVGRDRIEIVEGDIFNKGNLSDLCAGVSCVIHLAGLVSALRGYDFHRVNVEGVCCLVDAANSANVDRFILLSSFAAYYPHRSAYGMSKHRGELCLQHISRSDMEWFILRPCAVYGAGDKMTAPLISQLCSLIGFIPGSRQSRFSLIHVDDLVRAMMEVVYCASFPDREIYCIHDGKDGGYCWHDLISIGGCYALFIPRFLMICAVFFSNLWSFIRGMPPLLSFSKVRDLYSDDWVCGDNPLSERLDWQAEIDLESGLRALFQGISKDSKREGGIL